MNLKLFLSLLSFAFALYEDQVGKIDWNQKYIGNVKKIIFHSNLMVSTSMDKIISGIDVYTGNIIWRHVLDKRSQIQDMILCEKAVISISSYGGVIRAHNTISGSLIWDLSTFDGIISNSRLYCSEDKLLFSHSEGTGVIELNKGKIKLINKEKSLSNFKTAYLDGEYKVTFLGKTVDENCYSIGEDLKWKLKKDACSYKYYFNEYSMMIYNKSIQLMNLREEKSVQMNISEENVKLGQFDQDYFTLSESDSLAVYSYKNDELSKAGSIKSSSKFHKILNYDGNHYLVSLQFQEGKSFKNSQIAIYAINKNNLEMISSKKIHIPSHNGEISDFQVTIDDKSFGRVEELMRVVIVATDYSITAFSGTGEKIWTREEALAHVVSAEFADLPISDIQASIEEEFEENTSILDMFVNRLKAQVHQVALFFQSYLSKVSEIEGKEPKTSSNTYSSKTHYSYPPNIDDLRLSRDNFNLNKLIILVTSIGKIYGIESKSGKLVWAFKIPDAVPLSQSGEAQIFNQRSSSHHVLPPVTTILMESSINGRRFLVSFNPITGIPLDIERKDTSLIPSVELPFNPIQVMLYPHSIETHSSQNHTGGSTSELQKEIQHINPIIFLSDDAKVFVYPSKGAHILKDNHRQFEPLFFHVINKESCNIMGYRVIMSKMHYNTEKNLNYYNAKKIWSINLDNENSPQTIIASSSKNPNEIVHSIGRVLADRSVLYKYLNPNLIAVITRSKEEDRASFPYLQNSNSIITVYLLDSVVGSILHSVTHQKSGNPVSLVVSENWILYSYYSFKNTRTEMALLELFEQKSRNDQLDTWSLFLRALTYNGPGAKENKAHSKASPGMEKQEESDELIESVEDYLDREDLFTFSSISRDVSGIRTTPDGKATTGSQLLVPVVLAKSYLFGTALNENSFAVTLTQKGITSKSILMSLKNGAIMEAPLHWLDPSINMELSPEAISDVYQPEIPLSPINFINYNQTQLNVRKIKTIPSGLESTSLVFAYGIDLFHTRIAPSKAFDLLKEDFDYFFISVVTLGMIVGTFITHRLAARKIIMRAWA